MATIETAIKAEVEKLEKPVILGISGFGGSGKSTFANVLKSQLNAPVIGVDSFFSGHRDTFDHWEVFDFDRLKREILHPFSQGAAVLSYREFDWEKHAPGPEKRVNSGDLLIVEGVGLFRPGIRDYFNLTIWIDCPVEEAVRRGKKRDREEYNTPHDALWDGIWKDNDLQCYGDFGIEGYADLSIDHSTLGIFLMK